MTGTAALPCPLLLLPQANKSTATDSTRSPSSSRFHPAHHSLLSSACLASACARRIRALHPSCRFVSGHSPARPRPLAPQTRCPCRAGQPSGYRPFSKRRSASVISGPRQLQPSATFLSPPTALRHTRINTKSGVISPFLVSWPRSWRCPHFSGAVQRLHHDLPRAFFRGLVQRMEPNPAPHKTFDLPPYHLRPF